MRYFILLLLVISQAACVGSNKIRPNAAMYDFGLANESTDGQRIVAKTDVEEITAVDSLNYQQMRYRLNYENASRVFFYAESRWVSPPAELLSNKLNTMLQLEQQPLACSLKLKLQVFDHVFMSPTSSEGMVQMNALLIEKKTHKTLSSEPISETVAATTQNAEGGAKALARAGELALAKAVNWANAQAEQNIGCQSLLKAK